MAAEIRLFASPARSPEVICELFETAERFDRMAAHVERRLFPETGLRTVTRKAGRPHITIVNRQIYASEHPFIAKL